MKKVTVLVAMLVLGFLQRYRPSLISRLRVAPSRVRYPASTEIGDENAATQLVLASNTTICSGFLFRLLPLELRVIRQALQHAVVASLEDK